MTNAELDDLEAALRRGADVDVEAPADTATRAAISAADREGLVDVAIGTVESPVGDLFVAVTARGLVRLAFDPEQLRRLDDLAARISPRVLEATSLVDPVRRELDEYFAGRRRQFDLEVDLSLTSGWGRRVLEATARIPAGQVATYGALAAQLRKPGAARAVGSAMATNPIPLVVPCHRVLRTDGTLGGFRWGVEVKRRLLAHEAGGS